MNGCRFHRSLKTIEAIKREIIPVGRLVPSSEYPVQVPPSKFKFFIDNLIDFLV